MDTIDVLFLVGLSTALIALLVFSKVIRTIAWESLRHPFTPSRIEVKGDKIEVHRLARQPAPSDKSYDPPAGAS